MVEQQTGERAADEAAEHQDGQHGTFAHDEITPQKKGPA